MSIPEFVSPSLATRDRNAFRLALGSCSARGLNPTSLYTEIRDPLAPIRRAILAICLFFGVRKTRVTNRSQERQQKSFSGLTSYRQRPTRASSAVAPQLKEFVRSNPWRPVLAVMSDRLAMLQKGVVDSWDGSDSGLGGMTSDAFRRAMELQSAMDARGDGESAAAKESPRPVPRRSGWLSSPRKLDIDRRLTEIFSSTGLRRSLTDKLSSSMPMYFDRGEWHEETCNEPSRVTGGPTRPDRSISEPASYESFDSASLDKLLSALSIDDSEVDSGSSRRSSASPDEAGPAVKRDSAFEDAGSFADDDDEDGRIADATDVIDQRRVLPWAPCKQTVGGYALNWILGEGAFSTVWKAIGPTNKSVIVKCVEVLPRYQAKGEGRYLSEAEVMRRAHHPRIVQLIDSWVTAESTFLVMEYLPDGDLFNALDEGVVSPEQSMEYMCQAAQGLEYLHTEGIVHNDLKLENMLIGPEGIKLCDFGLSGLIGEIRHGIAQGTSAYMAPELLSIKEDQSYVLSPAFDIWSFGIVLYAVVFASIPWEEATKNDVSYLHFMAKRHEHTAELWSVLNDSFKFLLLAMLDVADRRATLRDVLNLIREPWVKEHHDVVCASDSEAD
eukprot:m.138434 g.138434  ORF g.138434 m.138434 type:complete len:612 (-) comp14001_c0_seq9:437-2272(-)